MCAVFTIIVDTSAASTPQINSDLEPHQLLPVQLSILTLYDIRLPSHIHFIQHPARRFLLTSWLGHWRQRSLKYGKRLHGSRRISSHSMCNFRRWNIAAVRAINGVYWLVGRWCTALPCSADAPAAAAAVHLLSNIVRSLVFLLYTCILFSCRLKSSRHLCQW